jgi:hypothetical protein
MDPDNYDDFGGIQHAEYCFQVNLQLALFRIWMALRFKIMNFIYIDFGKFVSRSHSHSHG